MLRLELDVIVQRESLMVPRREHADTYDERGNRDDASCRAVSCAPAEWRPHSGDSSTLSRATVPGCPLCLRHVMPPHPLEIHLYQACLGPQHPVRPASLCDLSYAMLRGNSEHGVQGVHSACPPDTCAPLMMPHPARER